MQEAHRQMPTRVLLKRFIPYFYKYKWLLAADLLAASLTTVCELVLPLIVRRITNGALGTAGALTTGLVLRLGALYILLRVVDAGANYYMQSEGHIMGAKIETDMRHDLFHHLQLLSFSFYNNTKVGQIMSRITSDLFDITEFAHHAPENFLISGIKVIIAFIILSGMNIYLTLLIFAVLPFMIYFTRYFNRLMRIAGKECRHQVGEINAQVEDSLLGVRVDEARCSGCGACVRGCGMDVRQVGDQECIHCAKCLTLCPEKAISLRAGKAVLKAPAAALSTEAQARRRKTGRIAWALALAVLCFALLWFNVLDPAVLPAG